MFDQEFELVREGRYLCLGCRSEFGRSEALRHLRGRVCPEAPVPVRVTITGTIYARAIRLAHSQNQTIGEKSDYYITLAQLERILATSTQARGQGPGSPSPEERNT